MKKAMIKVLLTGIFSLAGVSILNAQQTSDISEIQLSNDGFGQLRQLIAQNFDFTAPGVADETVSSKLTFEIGENGKLANIHATGENAVVNEELEQVLEKSVYRFKPEMRGRYQYTMPVTVSIASR